MISDFVTRLTRSQILAPVRVAPGGFAISGPRLRRWPGIRGAGAAMALLLAGCGGVIAPDSSVPVAQNLGHDWRRHYGYGLQLLAEPARSKNSDVFARAAFSSAARFARDYSPAYVGLGVAEMRLGNFASAQVAFLNAALIENRSRYWAWGAIAALNNGDELVARAFYDGMQSALQEVDPASEFIRALYQVKGYPGAVERRQAGQLMSGAPAGLVCEDSGGRASSASAGGGASVPAFGDGAGAGDWVDDEDEDEEGEEDSAALTGGDRYTLSTRGTEDLCRNLNIVANVYFVRRFSSKSTEAGTDFFRDLTFQLNAVSSREWSGSSGNLSETFLKQVELSIPEIQYALRVTPQLTHSSVQVSAAPSVMTSLGNESQIKEGSDLTILYNSSGDAEQFTARTGMTLHLRPERATPDYVRLALNFEYSAVSSVEPTGSAQILGVSTNSYAITGTFPYGRPVVLGTISTGSQSHNDSGQRGLRRLPGFGSSGEGVSAADTIVLGVLSEPEAFRGTRERQMLLAMQQKGVRVRSGGVIERRRSVHTAPDVATEASAFLSGLPPV